ncbi:diphosphate--fructose-6-phosphate 1-phosphotransferase [Mesorhizobium sp. 10J20-29]
MAETFVIAQGGGPTAVINQTMVGATLEVLRRHPGARVLGARHGVRGVRDGDYVVLSDVPEAQLRLIAGTPSAALGSTRDKPDAAYCDKVLAGLKKVSADAFIYIGGNDTSGTQQILTDASGGSIAFVHAPKTIDNDLMENDHTPGFISAAEFVAGAFLSVDLDFRALPGVYVAIVMGRHAGFLTAASAAWRLDEDSGPHLIYVPERAFSVPRFIDDVRAKLARHKRCIVAVSEGVSTEDGRSLVETIVPEERLERDAHGNLKLSGGDLGLAFEHALRDGLPGQRARVDALGYMPRGSIAAISKVDQQEAFDAGVHAVEAAAQGGGSVALQFDGEKTVLKIVPLSAVAAKTRHMPDDYLDASGTSLSEKGMAYMKRLVPKKYDVGKPFV